MPLSDQRLLNAAYERAGQISAYPFHPFSLALGYSKVAVLVFGAKLVLLGRVKPHSIPLSNTEAQFSEYDTEKTAEFNSAKIVNKWKTPWGWPLIENEVEEEE